MKNFVLGNHSVFCLYFIDFEYHKGTTISVDYQIYDGFLSRTRVKYERVVCKPRFLNRTEVSQLHTLPLQNKEAEFSRRIFIFSIFTDLAYSNVRSLSYSQIETNSERQRYIRRKRQKTDVEVLIPLHPIAEQILMAYPPKENNQDALTFPTVQSKRQVWTRLKAIGFACGIRQPLSFHLARHRSFYKRQIINRLYCLSIKEGNNNETSELLHSTSFCHFKEPLCLLQRGTA